MGAIFLPHIACLAAIKEGASLHARFVKHPLAVRQPVHPGGVGKPEFLECLKLLSFLFLVGMMQEIGTMAHLLGFLARLTWFWLSPGGKMDAACLCLPSRICST